MSKKSRNIIIATVGLILVVLVSSPRLKLFSSDSEKSAAGDSVDPTIPVTAFIVRPERISDKVLSSGTVLANEEVELKSEISGKIERILFREGSRVRKGDLLVKINDAELQAQLVKLESQVKLAEDIEQRRKVLFEKRSISPEDYERALNELNSIKAEIRLIKARIDKTEIKAPFDGIIGLRYVSEGSYVSSETKIAVLQDVTLVKVDFSIPEKYVNSVRKDQLIRFTVAGSDEAFAGKIYAIEPKIDPVTRTVQLRAISANRGGKIIPGAFAQVELVLQQLNNALMIPTEALVPELKGQKVFLYKYGYAQPLSVETGIRTETKIQITAGLQAEDTIITSGILQMAPGLPVRISEIN